MGWSPFRPTGLTYKDTRCFGGYTLITPIGGDAVYLLNESGLVVHQWKVPRFEPGYVKSQATECSADSQRGPLARAAAGSFCITGVHQG